jgi:hypothetical protein
MHCLHLYDLLSRFKGSDKYGLDSKSGHVTLSRDAPYPKSSLRPTMTFTERRSPIQSLKIFTGTVCHRVLRLAEMTVLPADTLVKGSTFLALLQDGLSRMLSVVKSDKFELVVKGESFETTLAEAVLISPKIYELLETDPTIRTFTICDVDVAVAVDRAAAEDVDGNSFKEFLECIHSREFSYFSASNDLPFLSICRLLGNERLTFLSLASLNSLSRSPSSSSSTSASPSTSTSTSSTRVSISPDVLVNFISSSEATIDYCASQFHLYSSDEIGRLDKHTLHRLLGSRSLRLESEDQFLNFLIDLGSDYFEFWEYIEPIFLSAASISLFGNTLPFDYVTEDIWNKLFVRIENKPDDAIRTRRFLNSIRSSQCPKSTILQSIPSILTEFETKTWELLYRGTRDGFGTSNFHSKCDQHANTLTIILTTAGYIFGGFTPIAWDSSKSTKTDTRSFLFSLKNPRNMEPKIFPRSSSSYSIYGDPTYGPTFGSGHGLYIANNCDQNTSSYTVLGSGYTNDTGIAGNQVFAGQQNFQVKEIEVFSINS